MSVIYYPKSSFMFQRDALSGSYEQISINVTPNTILYFDTSSNLNAISASVIYHTASNALFSETSSHIINGVVSGGIQFDTASINAINKEGYVFWDNDSHTLALKPDKTGSTLQIGQEMWLRVLAHEYIPNGAAVYISHAESGVPCGMLAIADITDLKSTAIGVSTEIIPSGSIGIVTIVGQVHDLDTSVYTSGDILYLSTTTSGSFQSSVPEDPFRRVIIGTVLVADSASGIIEVNISTTGISDYAFVGLTDIPTITTSSVSPSGSVINVGIGRANLCTTLDGKGVVRNYEIPSASFVLSASLLDSHYVVATYNSGSPIYQFVTDRTSVDSIQTTNVYTVTPGAGGSVSYVHYDTPGILLANKLLTRVGYTHGIERAYGLGLSESGSRYVEISSGNVWMGARTIDLPTFNSLTSRLVQIFHSGSNAWSSSVVTQMNNLQYDNGTGLATLAGGDWVVNWIYRGVGNLNTSIIQLSDSYGTKNLAIQSQPPTPPPELNGIAILVGRAIIQKNDVNATQVDSAFVQSFVPAGITTHNDLANIQGGVTGEYYHLTSVEYSRLSAYRTITGSVTLSNLDSIIYVSASTENIILTLPTTSSMVGQLFTIKKIDNTGYDLIISSSINIDYDKELRLTQRGSSVVLHRDDTQFWIH